MMTIKSYALALPCLLIMCSTALAQSNTDRSNHSISLSLFAEQLGIPEPSYESYAQYPLDLKNRGVALAIESNPSRGSVITISHMIELGYYRHQHINHVLFIGWKPKLELNLLNTIGVHSILGLSYAHSLPTKAVYTHDSGHYTQKRSLGHPHFMPSLGAGLSVDFFGLFKIPLELFVRHEAFGLLPYAPQGDFPLTIHHKLSAGLTISFD